MRFYLGKDRYWHGVAPAQHLSLCRQPAGTRLHDRVPRHGRTKLCLVCFPAAAVPAKLIPPQPRLSAEAEAPIPLP